MFEMFIQSIKECNLNVNNVLVIQNNSILFEYDFKTRSRYKIYSCTKSFLGVLAGIAIEEGFLTLEDNVYDTVYEELVNYSVKDQLEQWKYVTVQRLLTMSIIDFPMMCNQTSNWLKYIFSLALPNVKQVGFQYSNICAYLLSIMIEKKVGCKTADYMTKKLLHPLGIYDLVLKLSPEGYFSGDGMMLSVDELSRLGQLFYQKGMWNNCSIVSNHWIEQMIQKQNGTEEKGYGYLVWRLCDHGYQFVGMLGQICMMFTKQNAILTISSELNDFSDEADILNQIIWKDFYPEFIRRNNT